MLSNKYRAVLAKRSFCFGIEAIEVWRSLLQKKSIKIVANQLILSATSVGANTVEVRDV